MVDGIAGSQIKIERAIEHVKSLERKVVEFLHSNTPPFTVRHERDPKSGEVLFIATNVLFAPPSWGAIVGDAIHNLKSGIEHLWRWAIGGGDRRATSFPFRARNADALKACFQGVKKGSVTQKAVDALLSINPCKDWLELLWQLSIADDSDKHDIITPIVGVNRSIQVEMGSGYFCITERPDRSIVCPVKEGAVLLSVSTETRAKMKVEPSFPTFVAFGDISGKHGERAICIGEDIIVRFNQWVAIVRAIATAFESSGLPSIQLSTSRPRRQSPTATANGAARAGETSKLLP